MFSPNDKVALEHNPEVGNLEVGSLGQDNLAEEVLEADNHTLAGKVGRKEEVEEGNLGQEDDHKEEAARKLVVHDLEAVLVGRIQVGFPP